MVVVVTGPNHGGCLRAAAKRWGMPVEHWLDLSAGINPVGWPVPPIPAAVWQRLPEPDDGLVSSLRRWGHAPTDAACLPVPGTQAAIMSLPGLRQPCAVGVPFPGYEEHGYWWRRLGHQVTPIPVAQMAGADERWLDSLDVLVCINPNNPTGDLMSAERLLSWHRRLSQRRGWLVVDEAFTEASEGESLVPFTDRPGLVVLRSLGKFFGLAGVRAGAVFSDQQIGDELERWLGPWAVNGPARYLMARALADHAWQETTGQRLIQDSLRLHQLLLGHGLPASSGTHLFRYLRLESAQSIADALAETGILVRVFTQPPALRFGLPGTEPEWRRLDQALATLTKLVDR